MTDLYGRVIDHLSTNFIGVTDCPEMRAILGIVLSDEQAELVLQVSHPPVVHGARHIGRKLGWDERHTRTLLDELADRGVIARTRVLGRSLYGLLPLMPGLYELTFMKADTYPDHKAELRQLWKRYKRQHLGSEISDYPTPVVRVIPVHAELPVEHRVFRYEDVERIIDRAGFLSVGRCACREVSQSCEGPLDVCMMFDQIGANLVENGFARRIDVTEAKRVLNVSEEAGLVHCAMNCSNAVQILCNCCGCCCMALQGVVELQRRGAVAVSTLVAHIDPRSCTGCGDCLEWCWPDAIAETDETCTIDAQRCLGCGLCARQCHVRAIELRPRPGPHPSRPHNPATLTMRMAKERGKAAALARALAEEIR